MMGRSRLKYVPAFTQKEVACFTDHSSSILRTPFGRALCEMTH